MAIFPGIVASIVTENLVWLLASFLAVCSIIPYVCSHGIKWVTLLNGLLICAVAYALHLMLLEHWDYFLMSITIIAIFMGFMDNAHPELRSLSSWIIIACVYGAVKLGDSSVTKMTLWAMTALVVAGVMMVLMLPLKDKAVLPHIKFVPIKDELFLFNFKYMLPTVISISVCHYLKLSEPEWVIWSSLSVVYPELDAVLLKFRRRALAAGIGVCSGLAIGLVLPHSVLIPYFCFIFICLSLQMFRDYFLAYLLRSSCVVIYAVNQGSMQIALDRILNVVLGGMIGLVSTYALIYLYRQMYNNNTIL
jgi:Fusaric acid resistance protein-like